MPESDYFSLSGVINCIEWEPLWFPSPYCLAHLLILPMVSTCACSNVYVSLFYSRYPGTLVLTVFTLPLWQCLLILMNKSYDADIVNEAGFWKDLMISASPWNLNSEIRSDYFLFVLKHFWLCFRISYILFWTYSLFIPSPNSSQMNISSYNHTASNSHF